MLGSKVSASVESVQAAMDSVRPDPNVTHLGVNIFDSSSSNSWPLSYITYATIYQNITTDDCTAVQELLLFYSWTHLNDQAFTLMEQTGHVPLTAYYIRYMIDSLGTITCNGERAYPQATLIGIGGAFSIFPKWASNFESRAFKMKYFTTAFSALAIEKMIDGTYSQHLLLL